MASVTQTLKEGLVGAEKEDQQQYSAQHRAEFMKNAAYDAENDEWYMSRQEFVDAIAPVNEDYVSIIAFHFLLFCSTRVKCKRQR